MMIIKDFENYRVCVNNKNNTNIFVITFASYGPNRKLNADINYPKINQDCFVTKKGMNRIDVQLKRNDWYLRNGIEAAAAYIKSIKADNDIFITYGGSMGGVAAIEYSVAMAADFFVATSPQYSFKKSDMQALKDPRWEPECTLINNTYQVSSRTYTGINKHMQGIVFVDQDHELDCRHAEKLKAFTQAIVIKTRGTGHLPGKAVNNEYSITKLLKEIGESSLLRTAIDEIASRVNAVVKQGYAYKFMEANPVERLSILMSTGAIKAKSNVEQEALLIDFKKSPNEYQALTMLVWANICVDQGANQRAQILRHIHEQGYQQLLKNIPELIIGFYDRYSENYLMVINKIIGPDLFRDEGIRLEKSNNLKGALFCMRQAKLLRPHGGLINTKLKQYQNALL